MSESLIGKLLVASSLVTDPMYAGGVCLIVHHDEDQLIGVMLNRPLTPSPEAVAAMLGEADDSDAAHPRMSKAKGTQQDESCSLSPWRLLHFGGPLSGPVVAVHPISQYADVETGQGIYVAAQKHHLEHLLREQPGPCRLIVGHLGWATGQLEQEIEHGLWHVVPATAETVFSPAQEMWPRIIRRATSGSLARWIGVKDVPQAAEQN